MVSPYCKHYHNGLGVERKLVIERSDLGLFLSEYNLGVFLACKSVRFDRRWLIYKERVKRYCLPIHFVYGMVLCQPDFLDKELLTNFKYILAMGGFFFLSEMISYFAESSLNRTKPLNLATVQLFPYARILPMHFLMFVGIGLEVRSTNPHLIVMVFLLLKALADIAMYLVERHSVFGNLVTYLFEKHTDWSVLPDNLKAKLEVCRFCQRVIVRNGTRTIKDHVVCKQCYQRIEKEVASQKRQGEMTIDE